MNRIFITLLSICFFLNSFSQNEIENWYTPKTSLYDLNGDLKPATINNIEYQDQYNTLINQPCFTSYNSNFWVEFVFNQKDKTYYQTTEFDASIDVLIEYWENGVAGGPHGTYTTTLNLSRKNSDDNKNKFLSYYVLPNSKAYSKVKVSVLSGTNVPILIKDLFSVQIGYNAKYFKQPYFSNFRSSTFVNNPIPSTISGIKIDWELPYKTCSAFQCDEYDFEWTFLDYYGNSSLVAPYSTNSNIIYESDNIFSKLKYSRLTTKKQSIDMLPLMYPKGYLICRLREVYYDYLGSRIEGEWKYSFLTNNTLTSKNIILTLDGHESKLNWTNNLSFAENATHKSVLTYFDGSQRDRQSVTFNMSDSVPVIAETFYDKEGRKAASILPSPELTDKTIKFYRNYNMSKVTGFPYDFSDFNNLTNCTDLPNILDSNSGSAKYYSTNNILKNTSFHAFIPNAGGYPLSTIEYSNDNEGKIKRQSGVGKDFQFGSGKETRYMYGGASKQEINRLFGTDVGYNSHYFKNLVIDPNGQISVSYLDMSGKTIATSLAGNAANSTIIPNTNNTGNAEIMHNLIEPDNFKVDIPNIDLYGNKTHLVTGNQTMTFYAKANQVDYIDTCKNITCADCYFDMNIKVKSKCIPFATNFERTFKNYTNLDNIDISCIEKLPAINDSFQLDMPTGEYYVSSNVTIPQKVIDFYTNEYLEHGACFPSLDSLIKKYKARMAPCIHNCQECNDMYGDTLVTINKMMAQLKTDGQKFVNAADSMAMRSSLSKYAQAAKSGCNDYCKPLIPCDVYKQLLIADVSPGGQYGMKFDTTNTSIYKDSMFNSLPIEGKQRPGWRIHNDGTSVYTSANLTAKNILSITGESFNLTTPEGLREFAGQWDESFGEKLMEYHPEYCYYQYCIANTDHHLFFDELDNIETWSEAQAKGYLPMSLSGNNFKNSSDLLVNADPYFTNPSSDGAPIKLNFETGLKGLFFKDIQNNNWPISIFDLAMLFSNPKLWTYSTSMSGNRIVGVTHNFNYKYLDTCDCDGLKDMVWNQFKFLYKKISTYKYEELRDDVACPAIKPKLIGIFNADLERNNTMGMFFPFLPKTAVTLLLPYAFKMPRFFNTNDIRNNFNTNINALVKDPNTGKYRTQPQMEASAKAEMKLRCDSNCIYEADGWIAALSNCVLDKENLKKDLILVCQSSCGDARYGFGTKTTPYNQKSVYLKNFNKYVSSFQEVIDLYRTSPADVYCTADYIYQPPNWGQENSQFLEEDVLVQNSTCACEKLSMFVNTKVINTSISSTDVADLHANLLAKFGEFDFNMTVDDLRRLIKSCKKKDGICTYPDKMLFIPNIFSCHNFTTCKEINRAHKQFKKMYPQFFIENVVLDEASFELAKLRQLYEGFMNRQLKMNLTYHDYLKQIDSCSGCDTINCDYWKRLFRDFLELKNNYPRQFEENISNDTPTMRQFWHYVNKVYGTSSSSSIGWNNFGYTLYPNYDSFLRVFDTCIMPCSNINTCYDNFIAYITATYPGMNTTAPFDIEFLTAMAGYMNYCMYDYTLNLSVNDYVKMLERCRGPMPMTISCGALRHLVDAYNKIYSPDLKVNDPVEVAKFIEWLKTKLGLTGADLSGIDFDNLFTNCFICNIDCDMVKAAKNHEDANRPPGTDPIKPYSPTPAEVDGIKNYLIASNPGCNVRITDIMSQFNSSCFHCDFDCIDFMDAWFNISNNPIYPSGVWPSTTVLPMSAPIFSPTPGYTEDQKVGIFINYLQGLSKFGNCIIDRQAIIDMAWRMWNSRLCTDPCKGTGCPIGPGGPGNPKDKECCINGKGWCCPVGPCNTPPCETTPLNCCDRFKLFWNTSHYHKTVFDNPIPEEDLGTILSSIRTSYLLYNSFPTFKTGCEDYWDDDVLKDLIEKCLGKKITFKGQSGSGNYDPGAGKVENGTGDPGPSGPGGPPCCGIIPTTAPIDWLMPKAATESSFAPKSVDLNLGTINLSDIKSNFNTAYIYNVMLASAAPAALPPPIFPHPFESLNFNACNRLVFDNPVAPRQEVDDSACERMMLNLATSAALEEYHKLRQEAVQNFQYKYIKKCLSYANASVDAKGIANEFQYTLYYYGQDGNLLRTVPPAGFNPLTPAELPVVETKKALAANLITEEKLPPHTLPTNYKYNSLNQVFEQSTPDAGVSKFAYDQLGRLIISQNAQQAVIDQNHKKYSYTIYDDQSRIVESGEIKIPSPNYGLFDAYFSPTTNYVPYTTYKTHLSSLKSVSSLRYVTRTYYDYSSFSAVAPEFGGAQENLRKRISSITLDTLDTDKGFDPTTYHTALHYSYDVLGNVKTLVAENKIIPNPNQQFKKVEYDYDLVSGKVNHVTYQRDRADQFIHKYKYDAENRIVEAKTSTNNIHWDRDASYQYYLHGPLARTQLGEQDLQGLDYAYTLQGWLKSVNASVLDKSYDMGRDGDTLLANNKNANIARDALALSLRYFNNDYRQIGKTTQPVEAQLPAAMNALNLYNGNISSQVVSIKGLTQPTLAYQYRYDQLNRLLKMDAFQPLGAITSNNLSTATATTKYQEVISYDPNGNILTYNRKNDAGAQMDQLTYNYDAIKRNQLKQVQDAVGNTVNTQDIDNQIHLINYKYDNIGNLIRDEQENLDISWTPTGKISSIIQNTKNQKLIFAYDPMGNRISKAVYKPILSTTPYMTYYSRDAQGNTMAVYDNQYIADLVTICDYTDQAEISDWVSTMITDYTDLVFNSNQANQQILVLESTNFIRNYLSNEDDSCRWKMKNYFLSQFIQIPDQLVPPLNDVNLLYPLKSDIENMINNSKPLSQINSDMQSLYSSEDPLTIEAWVTYLYGYISFPISDYYNNLLAQNFSYTTTTIANTSDSLYWKEQHIYGSSRLGMYKPDREMVYADIPNVIAGLTRNHFTGMRQYELTNHLGNVLATIKDEKKQMPRTNNLFQAGYYEPIVQFASDYYPFGMEMPGRQYSVSSSSYRFGFNGKENDKEVDGQQDYGFRIYDRRLGRFKSVDPLSKSYPWNSPYAFAENDVIRSIDLEGLEKYIVTVRAFIPMASLPNPAPWGSAGVKGDNRNYFSSNSSQYRTEQKVSVDFDNKQVVARSNKASGSTGIDKSGKEVEHSEPSLAGPLPTYDKPALDKGTKTTINMQANAHDKLIMLAPNINYDLSITLEPQKDGSLNYQVKGTSDGFPAYEVWVTDQATNNSMLLLNTNPTEAKETPWSLWGGGEHSYNQKGTFNNNGSAPAKVPFEKTQNTQDCEEQ